MVLSDAPHCIWESETSYGGNDMTFSLEDSVQACAKLITANEEPGEVATNPFLFGTC